MTIRLATQEDSAAAVDVVREVYEEFNFTWDEGDYHADLYDLKSAYLDQGHYFWLAETEDRAIGVVALEIFDAVPGDKEQLVRYRDHIRIAGTDCALQRLYVRPSARKAGLGNALMQKVVNTAKESNRTMLEIWSDKRFVEAHRLYERFGARVLGDRICHDPDQSPEWGLVITL